MIISRRGFVLGVLGVIVTHHRPNHRGGPVPTPTPTPAGPGFLVGHSLTGGPDVVGGME
jgi:hypothetical protein